MLTPVHHKITQKITVVIDELSSLWWLFSVRASLAIVFGAFAYIMSDIMRGFYFFPIFFVFLAPIVGFYAIASGVVLLTGGLYCLDHHLKHSGILFAESLFGIAFGIFICASTRFSMANLSLVFGIHAAVIGAMQLLFATRLQGRRPTTIAIGIGGLFSLISGLLFILYQRSDTTSLTGYISSYSILAGAFLLLISIRLRSLRQPLPAPPTSPAFPEHTDR